LAGDFWAGWELWPGISKVWLDAVVASPRNRIVLTMPGKFFTGPPLESWLWQQITSQAAFHLNSLLKPVKGLFRAALEQPIQGSC
jgi:hypothetical protein